MLFISLRFASSPLQMSALALALSSTIFALLGYAFLEGLKIHLYQRLVHCLEESTRSLRRLGMES